MSSGVGPSPRRRRRRPPSPDAAGDGDLDSLPPELLSLVLSRLPLRDAVRTSALARAWRRRWESVPGLRFRWRGGADPRAISGVLRRYACPVREFLHAHVPEASFRHAGRWLRLLALRGVHTLDLNFETNDELLIYTLHPSIFSCRALKVLELRGCNVPAPPPGFAGLPELTSMRLCKVDFPEGGRVRELLIATAPLLEQLCLDDISVPDIDGEEDHWVIQAPRLRSFSVTSIFDPGWQINDLPSLEEADIDCFTYSTDRDYIKLMKGLVHARELQLGFPPRNYNILEGLSCSFDNLKSLLLRTSLRLLSSTSCLFSLLRNAPKLEDLVIELIEELPQDDELDSEFLNAQWSDDLFSSLTHVTVKYVRCKLSEMYFIEFVLSKATRLQEFHVYLDRFCPKSNEDAVTELVKYRRASSQAKLFFSRW
ncbi:hypothetical protein ACP4OV_018114 [Aristida adscensionis]